MTIGLKHRKHRITSLLMPMTKCDNEQTRNEKKDDISTEPSFEKRWYMKQ